MKCLRPLILALVIATQIVAAAPTVSAQPLPCSGLQLAAVSTPPRLNASGRSRSAAEIPNPLKRPAPVTPLGCDRPFVYQGEVYQTDAPQVQDASNLKYFTRKVPEATSILDEYQNNRKKSTISAYSGTIGVLVFIFALPLARKLNQTNPDQLAGILKIGAASLAASGFVYSYSLLSSNEALLPKAVDTYNQANPKDPIELRFSAGWSF